MTSHRFAQGVPTNMGNFMYTPMPFAVHPTYLGEYRAGLGDDDVESNHFPTSSNKHRRKKNGTRCTTKPVLTPATEQYSITMHSLYQMMCVIQQQQQTTQAQMNQFGIMLQHILACVTINMDGSQESSSDQHSTKSTSSNRNNQSKDACSSHHHEANTVLDNVGSTSGLKESVTCSIEKECPIACKASGHHEDGSLEPPIDLVTSHYAGDTRVACKQSFIEKIPEKHDSVERRMPEVTRSKDISDAASGYVNLSYPEVQPSSSEVSTTHDSDGYVKHGTNRLGIPEKSNKQKKNGRNTPGERSTFWGDQAISGDHTLNYSNNSSASKEPKNSKVLGKLYSTPSVLNEATMSDNVSVGHERPHPITETRHKHRESTPRDWVETSQNKNSGSKIGAKRFAEERPRSDWDSDTGYLSFESRQYMRSLGLL